GDSLNRFSAKESLAFQNGFLQKPLVNIWAEKIKEEIKKRYQDFFSPEKKYQCISTIDIDNAYAYKHKGIVRTIGGFAKDILRLNFKNTIQRVATVFGTKPDVYDTYSELFRIQNQNQFQCIYFFLLADFGNKDKNLPTRSKKFQSLIKYISEKCE